MLDYDHTEGQEQNQKRMARVSTVSISDLLDVGLVGGADKCETESDTGRLENSDKQNVGSQ